MITEADIDRAIIDAFRAVFARRHRRIPGSLARFDQLTEGGNIAQPAPAPAAILPHKVSKRRDPWEDA